jgi:hypothetical protein
VAGFGATDADGNIVSVTVNNGTLSGDSVCFTPVAGDNVIQLIVTDSCGDADTCETNIHVVLNSAPVPQCPGDDTLFVCDLSQICVTGFGATDADGNIVSVVVNNGTLSGDSVCFTPVAGDNVIQLIVTDACGDADTCETNIHVDLNSGPVAQCPGNDSLFVCDLSPICIPGFGASDVDGNISSVIVTGGTLSGDTVCFTPVVGDNVIQLVVTDACGQADTCYSTIHVELNSAPVAICPGDDTFFVCDLSAICVAGFGATDADGNIVSVTVSTGSLSGDSVCFTPVAGDNVIQLIVTDTCGEADTCETTIHVDLNSAPVASCPGDDTFFVCDLSPICVPGFGATDADGNIVSVSVSTGSLSGDTVCFTPVAGDNVVQLIVTDACGEADTCETTIHVDLNTPPVAQCPGSSSLFVCNLDPLCLTGFGASDADGNIVSVIVNNGTLSGDTVCFTPVAGANVIQLIVTDACGAADTCETTVTVTLNSAPVCNLPADTMVFQCQSEEICLTVGASDVDGNFDYCEVFSGAGSITGNQWCFTPSGAGVYSATIRCYDSCGAYCEDDINVTVEINNTPVLTCPSAIDTFLCAPDTICYQVSLDDPDDGIESDVSPIGWFNDFDSTVCFYADTSGTYEITLIITDGCGAADTCMTTITVELNEAPQASCAQDDSLFACDLSQICVPGFSATDPNNNIQSVVAIGGTLDGDSVCFTPVAGNNVITLIATDACGLVDSCQTTIHVSVNTPPVLNHDTDLTVYQCQPDTVCVQYFVSDADNNVVLEELLLGPGWIDTAANLVCFVPPGSGNYDFVTRVTDACGATDVDTFRVVVTQNTGPTASCPPSNDTIFVCALDTICITGFSCDDADGNLTSCVVNNGVLVGDTMACFQPVAGLNTIVLTATDDCGLADVCTTRVHVLLNAPPVANAGADQNVSQCTPTQICWNAGCSDPDGNLDSCTKISGPGTFDGSQICFTPAGSGTSTFVIRAVDDCGATDYDTVNITVTLNSPPICGAPNDTSIGGTPCPDTICLVFYPSDPDNNLSSCEIDGNPYTSGSPYCIPTPRGTMTYVFLTCTDACGAQSVCSVLVNAIQCPPIVLDSCPDIVIEKTHMSLQGQHEYVDVTVTDGLLDMGGYDMLLCYDRSCINFQTVLPGELHSVCGWEYFTYRTWFWPSYEPHFFWGGCIRVIAIADQNNGNNHPICRWLATPFTLFTLDVLVTDNRLYECQFCPISFFWTDCGDNTISDRSGDTLYVSDRVFGYDLVNEITNPSTGFPTYTGVQLPCFEGEGPGKPLPLPCIDFYSGGVDIACADSIDDRGDINLNGISNEISDAVVLTNYFIYGLGAFHINVAGQTAASDVNADGLALTVGDLVYLIRVIVGDALPYPKLTPVTAGYTVTDGYVAVDAEMGAALVVVEGQIVPTLLADQMEMKSAFDAEQNVTRILVYSFDAHTFDGEFLQVEGNVVDIEFGSPEGAVVKTTDALPGDFELSQNYPNPFNPTTTISFTLPGSTDYTLSIYNVTGQIVREFAGRADAGQVSIEFGADELASGVYLYRLTAGSHSMTKKMLLLK